MRIDDAIAQLQEHQSSVLARVDAVERLLAAPAADAQVPLAKLRWEMARLLRQYQLFKHVELFDPVIAKGDQRALVARQMKVACTAAGDRFDRYVEQWSRRDVLVEWPGYAAATRELTAGLRRHLAVERRQAEALLAGVTRTRQSLQP